MESEYSWTPAARKEFRAWLFATDHIARPNPKYAEHKVIEREEVCRDYLEREELRAEYAPNPNFRTCTKCGEEKPLISFYKSSTGGHSAVCKECLLAHQKEWYNKNMKRELKRVPTPEKKVCRECGKEKPIEAFRRNFASPDGYTHVCMECSKKKLSATIASKSGKPPKKSAPAVEAEPDPAPALMPVDIEELTPEKVAVETPKVKRGAEIEAAYDGKPSLFDEIRGGDLIMAFFPCIYFTGFSNPRYFTLENNNYKSLTIDQKLEKILERARDRETFYELLIKMVGVCLKRDIQLVFENPYSTSHFLWNNFFKQPDVFDKNRLSRGDYFMKPTGYWFFNCKPTLGYSIQKDKEQKTIIKSKSASKAGLCSEERSMISPDYARNFICDFIIDQEQPHSVPTLF